MTDSWLMEADCVHGDYWAECPACMAEVDAYFDAELRAEALERMGPHVD